LKLEADGSSELPTSLPANEIYLARITFVEVISAITRKTRSSMLSAFGASKAIADFRDDFGNEYLVIELTPNLIERAADLAEAHAVRAYDAVQLAAALQLNIERKFAGASAITVISADAGLNAAARAEGLAVDDPNTHP
jgi:uncharacterized protein